MAVEKSIHVERTSQGFPWWWCIKSTMQSQTVQEKINSTELHLPFFSKNERLALFFFFFKDQEIFFKIKCIPIQR